jgi:hypothetical protein
MAEEPQDQDKKEDISDPKELVEDFLGLEPFFQRHQDHILDKLEECDEIAEKARRSKDMIFFAESLPVIDGLIQVGTTREEYKSALKRVREEWASDVEPAHLISALTFLYVADRGKEIAEGKRKAKKARDLTVWRRIDARVHKLEP